MKYLILFSFFYATSSFAEKLSLICHPFDYDTETQQNKPLKQGAVRYVGQTLAGFLDSDTYSLRVSTECKGKGAEKVCLNITDELVWNSVTAIMHAISVSIFKRFFIFQKMEPGF